ncbi:MAG: Restriction alleviation protein Lar, partial [Sphingomonadales bacterium]|nr:Restriction alleviation protein Lar [Sphingomonadales bacterium]
MTPNNRIERLREALEPCPFCGKAPRGPDFQGDEDGGYWFVECPDSGQLHFAGVHGDSEEETVREWNTRALTTPTEGDGAPIPMLLFCPVCGLKHVDEPDERSPDW